MEEITIEYLKANSGLPGPRGNLELLNKFVPSCNPLVVSECLSLIQDDTLNSPEEFVGMCGVVGFALLNWKTVRELIDHLRKYSTHKSWRIREAVAIALQEIPVKDLSARLEITSSLESSEPFVHRAIVAGLCEPKNLKRQDGLIGVYEQLKRSTGILAHDQKLTEGQESLRKGLGYCWSVAVAASPEIGKKEFESLFGLPGKHILWIISENLKKKRMERMDKNWIAQCKNRLTSKFTG